ncbi:MAG: hypothetical protein WD314_00775 [Trueperaceae bacterium]
MAQRTGPINYRGSDDSGETSCDGRQPLSGWFMALFLTASVILSLANPALLTAPDEPLLDGSWAAAYQSSFDRRSPLLGTATTVWGVLEYALFRQGREGVLVGSDGWLYSSEEFEFPARAETAAAALSSNLGAAAAVQKRLADDGVDLVVALLPAKARLYPEHLGRYRLPAGPRSLYGQALAGLRAAGLSAVDLLEPLERAKSEQPVFLRTDTHWTPYGASTAAGAVAATIAGLGRYDWLGAVHFGSDRLDPSPYRGDLAGFLPLGPFYDPLGPEDDLLARRVTERSEGPGDDLFAAVELPVALVGTSYSQDDRWNFAGSLRKALGNDVLVAAQEGEGPYRPMLDYLQGDAYRSAKPEVVIWEIPERYLSQYWETEGTDQ